MNEKFMKYSGNTDLSPKITNLQTPLEFFKYIFYDEL